MRIPQSTYRIQFTPSFGFEKAGNITAYLRTLGISDIYASPIFSAVQGSTHGYDVVDPCTVNPELGGLEEFKKLARNAKSKKLGWLQDIVPNHMAFDSGNTMLMDVLEKGANSEFINVFDIEWNHPYETIRGRLLAPFLGSFYATALENGQIKLKYEQQGLSVYYYSHRFPLKIETYTKVLKRKLPEIEQRLGADHPDVICFLGIAYLFETLPESEGEKASAAQIDYAKKMLWEYYTENENIRAMIDENLAVYNPESQNPEDFNELDSLLSEQNFRLAFWKVATEEINYRRFFTINQLICLKVENQDVFDLTHKLILKLCENGLFTGLRIDHVDGLYDPENYLERLCEATGQNQYIVVEKILQKNENLPAWPIAGTSGYDFMNFVNGIFCKQEHHKDFSRIYFKFAGHTKTYEELAGEKKRLIIGKHLAGNIDNLAHQIKAISGSDRHGSDITLYGLRRALVEVLVYFPVYRTYINSQSLDGVEKKFIQEAIDKARENNPALVYEMNFIENFLLLKFPKHATEHNRQLTVDFCMQFQQLTGALMAKGFEDTLLYVYNRLLSLNEVGSEPCQFGMGTADFHTLMQLRAKNWPSTMNATATHDNKRGEDVRARINVLSEIPQEWSRRINIWRKMNRNRKMTINKGIHPPEHNDEYFLYQTVLGTLPLYEGEHENFYDRLCDYAVKAVREAKVHTAWLKPDTDYEQAYVEFIRRVFNKENNPEFFANFMEFAGKVAYFGMFNSLSQTLLKITAPGVPDFYNGTELWDLTMVDPDNRREVDYKKREEYLSRIVEWYEQDPDTLLGDLMHNWRDARIKLFVIHRALGTRARMADMFAGGQYIALETTGRFAANIIAFLRTDTKNSALVVVPRFLTAVCEQNELPLGHHIWHDTQINVPPELCGTYCDTFSPHCVNITEQTQVASLLSGFPVAFLSKHNQQDKNLQE